MDRGDRLAAVAFGLIVVLGDSMGLAFNPVGLYTPFAVVFLILGAFLVVVGVRGKVR